MRLGFVGFGEAGFHIAQGLRGAGLDGMVAYDCNSEHAVLGEKIRKRAEQAGVELVGSNAALAGRADTILSVVTASSAVEAARETSGHLTAAHLFCDCNSVAPSTKRTIAEAIGAARFVEAAILAPVVPAGHRVPILMNGATAVPLAESLRVYGMRLSLMDGEPGAAAAVKMCRSIVVKGMEALLVECTVAAREFGCEDAVWSSLNEAYPGMKWSETARYMAERVMRHGTRRAAEMREVALMQREAGLEPLMAAATAEAQDWKRRLGLDDFADEDEFLAALGDPSRIRIN